MLDFLAAWDVCDSAVVWWVGHRPSSWSVEDHIKNPEVNTRGGAEGKLARAVASHVIAQRKANPFCADKGPEEPEAAE